MRSRVWFALGTAAVLLLLLFLAYRDGVSRPATTPDAPVRYLLVAAVAAALFPLSLLYFAGSQRIDGFAFGSIVFAALIEVIIYVGWSASPQEEPNLYFFGASALPFVLIATTLMFNVLQKEG